nr:MAG TPA: hypothetical protein [Caudoviricetes sp.]
MQSSHLCITSYPATSRNACFIVFLPLFSYFIIERSTALPNRLSCFKISPTFYKLINTPESK